MSSSDKRRYGLTALMMAAIVFASAVISLLAGASAKDDGKLRIVATFYPVYVAALNVADGVDGVEVINLTPSHAGCLHDYQLTPNNMITLTEADVLVINGAGAESFLDSAYGQFPSLPVVDTSKGVALVESSHHHEEEEDSAHSDDSEEFYNEHIWTSPSDYIQQVENLRDGLIAADPSHAAAYRANAVQYIAQIEDVRQQLLDAAAKLPTTACITFHDSLLYFCKELGLNPVASLSMGEESGVSAADLANAEQAAAKAGKILLLYDSQYPAEYTYVADSAAYSRILIMDSAVSTNGSSSKTAWLDAMQRNIEQLKEAAL